MTRNLKLFTFGWSPEFVLRHLVEEGVSHGDIVLLISNKPEGDYAKKRVEEAYRQVESFLRMVGIVPLEYREVELEKGVLEVCRDLVRIVKGFEPLDSIKFYLVGGMRVLVVAALIVAKLLCSAGRRVEVKLSQEDRPISYNLPLELLLLDVEDVTSAQLELLSYLRAHGKAGSKSLAIGRSEVTVRKHLVKLREMGLVEYSVSGRRQVYRLSPLGEILLEVVK